MSGSGSGQRKYPSGSLKRKKANQLQQSLSKHQKITGFCVVQSRPGESENSDSEFLDNVDKDSDRAESVAITKVEEEEANRVLVQNVGDKKDGENKVGALQNVENVDDLKGEINEIKVASQTIDGHESCEHAVQYDSNAVQGNAKTDENTKNYSTDPALWNIDNDLINYWLRKGADFCRNNDGKFKKSAREYIGSDGKVKIRTLQPSLFQCELKNGQIIERDWLIYSPSNGCVYCFICRLFSNHQSSQFSSVGFNDWKNGIRRVIEHNAGSEHKECLNIYGKRKNAVGCIDNKIFQQAEKEFAYWKELVGHLVKAIKFLASRGLAFRGENQTIGSKKNGNYLGLLELMGDYSPFIKDHLQKYGNKGHGHTSYLSANICEELIELMGRRVFEYILNELRQAKYYSISVDSTPDNTKSDQLSFTVRYVNEKGPIERFLKFISIESHKSEYLTNTVFGFLDENKVTLGDCRGQSYDNATNMSGQYTGLQARIKEANKYAEYCPCAGHSLNLIGLSAAQCNLKIKMFFDTLQRLYVFLSGSTYRWQKLKEALDALETVLKVLKSLSETRWSARVDAVSAVYHAYDTILLVLDELAKDDTVKSEVQVEAASLYKSLTQFRNVFLLVVWYDILSRIHATNLTVQKANVDLGVVVSLLESLEQYIGGLREKFNSFLESAKVFARLEEIPEDENVRTRMRSTRLQRFEGTSENTSFSYVDSLRVEIFYPIIDSLIVNLQKRKIAYNELNKNFTFLTKLRNLNDEQIIENCKNIAAKYDKDLCEESLISECIQFKSYLTATGADDKLSFLQLYTKIHSDGIRSTFPNIEIVLRIFLSMMVTNCSGERSFSVLKYLKNDHRSSMLDARLSWLAIMYIESDVLDLIEINDLITDFAQKKSRKKL